MRKLGLLTVLLLAAAIAPAQDHHHAVDTRGDMAMGFDHDKTAHHFKLYADGGAIQVVANDSDDHEDIAAIRHHLQHVAKMFATGDFSLPMFIHNTTIPGLELMKRLHSKISYTFVELPKGGGVRIRSANRTAIRGIHSFLKLQIHDHLTGDPGRIEADGMIHRE